jgi:hypothetical protein
MAYLSKKYKESWDRGQNLENSFFQIIKKFDKHCRRANREEQFRHIDFISNTLGTFDVKARKRINRSANSEQDELVWIEFKNVSGNKGWLYGQADYIAFEREKDFLIIKRIYIQGLAETLCETNNLVTKASDALYKGYTREGRKDLISIIQMGDLECLPHEIWTK